MVSRKRSREETEAEEPPQEPSLLDGLRNMWEFASLMQYIYLFGKAIKIDEDFDIEELEMECLKPAHSEKLSYIGLALLKFVSSHKGLTLEIFDEFARRQFVAKAPERNPFGVEEEPNKFSKFDVFTKIRVLHQLSVWTLNNPDRIREKMPERDSEQTSWRIEPLGWDTQDRSYMLLDDDRLYRRTEPSIPDPPKHKSRAKSRRAKATRASKRRKVSNNTPESGGEEEEEHASATNGDAAGVDTFGGFKWECVAITLQDYHDFLESIRRTRDPNEKELHKRITDEVIPVIEKKVEEQERKAEKKRKELETLQKLACAKRSSRLASKEEKRKIAEAAAEVERKRQAELVMAKKEQERVRKMEEDRDHRMMTREQRAHEREVRRILAQEEVSRLEQEKEKIEKNESRLSERHLKSEMEKKQKELAALEQDEDWIFDCSSCGMHGENLDDGSHSIACEKCNVWQHSKCLGISKDEAEHDDFHFICDTCKHPKPKIPPLKLRFGGSNSPDANRTGATPTSKRPKKSSKSIPVGAVAGPGRPLQHIEINAPATAPAYGSGGTPAHFTNGISVSPPARSTPLPGSLRPLSASPTRPCLLNEAQTLPVNQPPARPPNGYPASNQMNIPNPSWQYPAAYPNSISYMPYQGPHLPNGSNVHQQGQRPSLPHDPFRNSFARQPTYSSPSGTGYSLTNARSHSMSPKQINGRSSPFSLPPINNPYTSFPPAAARPAAFSPNKQPSSPPQHAPSPAHLLPDNPNTSFPPASSHPAAHSPLKRDSSPLQHRSSPIQILPGTAPGYSPAKVDSPVVRPTSSHSISGTPVLPPVTALSPSSSAQILSPPSKKATPHPLQANGYQNGC